MKRNTLLLLMMVVLFNSMEGQTVTEKTFPLSKKAQKGYFYGANINDDGNILVAYKFKEGKDKTTYETYEIDKSLNLLKQEELSILKKDRADEPDYTRTMVYAWVGGCTSFDVLSMKLHLSKAEFQYTWNTTKKRYDRKKLSAVDIPLKDAGESGYKGYAFFKNSSTGEGVVLASTERKIDKKNTAEDFMVLYINTDMHVEKTPIRFEHKQSLVYAVSLPNVDKPQSGSDNDELNGHDIYLIFAPQHGAPDGKKYTLIKINNKGKIEENITFQSPSPNLILMAGVRADDGSIYFAGSHTKEADYYDKIFTDYAPLPNPCYTQGENFKMFNYEKKLQGAKMSTFCMLKFKNGKFEWSKSNDIKAMASKIATPPGQKKSPSYLGSRFSVQRFISLSNGDFLLTGQLTGRNKEYNLTYGNVVCLQINASGEVVSQYGVVPTSDKYSTLFEIPQKFYDSKDKKNVWWNLLEVKSIKGYESFFDAYFGRPTYYPVYFPSVIKLDPTNRKIIDYKILGGRKTYTYRASPYVYFEKENTLVYIGFDAKKNLWLGKVILE